MPECMRATLLVSYKTKTAPQGTGPRRGSNRLPFQQEKVVIGKVVSSSGGGVEIFQNSLQWESSSTTPGSPVLYKILDPSICLLSPKKKTTRIATRVQWSQNDGATPKLRDCKATLFTISRLWSYREGRSSKQG